MIKVLRITRHDADGIQTEALVRAARLLKGADEEPVEVTQHGATVTGADEVLELVKQHGAQVVEAVLPIGLLAQVVPALKEQGVPLLRAVMLRQVDDAGQASFTFDHYELVERVEVVTRRL